MRNFATGLLGILVAAPIAHGGLIAGDSYKIGTNPPAGEYQDATALKNQPATLVNTGFVNGPYASGSGTSNFTATNTGLSNVTVGSDATTGKVNWISAGADNLIRSNARNLSPTPSGSGPFYISHLVNRGSIATAGDASAYVLTGFGNTTAPVNGVTGGNLAGLFVGFAQTSDTNNFGNLVIRYRDTATANPNATSADAVLVDGSTNSTFGNTYLVVMKVDMNVSGGTDAVTWWLNPTNGSSDATLSSSSAATGSFDSFALQSAADFVRLNYSARNWTGTAFFDEPRLSDDLAGLGLAVPEPSSLGLIVAAAGLALRRRRQTA